LHFCYAYKFGLVTNGLGIVRHIAFYDEDFFADHPEIVLEKKSDSPDEDKSSHDSKLLIPTLQDFYKVHPLNLIENSDKLKICRIFNKFSLLTPKTFLGDSAFDAVQLYKDLLTMNFAQPNSPTANLSLRTEQAEVHYGDTFGLNRHFSKAYIPLNERSHLENADYTINEDGIPCCPNDDSLPMKPESSKSHLRCGLPTFKFVCPKMKQRKGSDGKYHRVTFCDNPCTPNELFEKSKIFNF